MQRRMTVGWKYKAGRRHIPDEAQHDVATYLFALLDEATANVYRLRPKMMSAERSIYESEYVHWSAVMQFIDTRLRQGIKSITDKRYKLASNQATSYLSNVTVLG